MQKNKTEETIVDSNEWDIQSSYQNERYRIIGLFKKEKTAGIAWPLSLVGFIVWTTKISSALYIFLIICSCFLYTFWWIKYTNKINKNETKQNEIKPGNITVNERHD